MRFARTYLKLVYGMWARIYDSILDKLFAFDRQRVINALQLSECAHVLEIGVGTGLNLPHYPAGVSVVGVDFSNAMLNRARKVYSSAQVRLICCDAHHLTLVPNSTFTHAIATFVLRVSPQKTALLNEIARVVKNKGTLVVLDEFRSRHWLSPLKLLLGFGQDVMLDDIIKQTPWQVVSRERLGASHTFLIVLENNKSERRGERNEH